MVQGVLGPAGVGLLVWACYLVRGCAQGLSRARVWGCVRALNRDPVRALNRDPVRALNRDRDRALNRDRDRAQVRALNLVCARA